jgi:hypothetical protein
MCKRAEHNSSKDGTGIVHVVLGNWQNLRERHPENDVEYVAQREGVDWDSDLAHTEWTVWWCRTADLANEDEEDGEEVGYVQCESLQGDECVEGSCAGDVDDKHVTMLPTKSKAFNGSLKVGCTCRGY